MKDAGGYRCSALNQYSHSYLRKKQGTVVLNVLNQPSQVKSITIATTIKLENMTITHSNINTTDQSSTSITTKKYQGN
jgi:hypothetical protein